MAERRGWPKPLKDTVPASERPAEATVEAGIERVDEFVVEDRLVTDVGGTIGVRVLSTPGMIAVMERNSAVLSYENLPEGKATVGFEVCVKHVSAAAEGSLLPGALHAARGRGRPQAALRGRGPRGRAHDRGRHPRAPGDRGRRRQVELRPGSAAGTETTARLPC